MNEAIKLAIEQGGYNVTKTAIEGNTLEIIFDPLFWQALSFALNWNKGQLERQWKWTAEDSLKQETYRSARTDEWLYHWHRFIDHVAEGKDPDEFFKELIKPK
jgi:hypothetical protein